MMGAGLMRRMVAWWRLFRLRRRLPAGARGVINLDPARPLDQRALAQLYAPWIVSELPAMQIPVKIVSVGPAGVRVVSMDEHSHGRRLTLAASRVVAEGR